jgi:hypothetical protein
MSKKQPVSELLGKVAKRIEAQDILPTSPGVLVGNEPAFCTGAAFIYEAVQMSLTPAASRNLAFELLKNGKIGLIQKAVEFDLDVGFVEQAISMNDSFADDERKPRMHETVLKLAAEGRP